MLTKPRNAKEQKCSVASHDCTNQEKEDPTHPIIPSHPGPDACTQEPFSLFTPYDSLYLLQYYFGLFFFVTLEARPGSRWNSAAVSPAFPRFFFQHHNLFFLPSCYLSYLLQRPTFPNYPAHLYSETAESHMLCRSTNHNIGEKGPGIPDSTRPRTDNILHHKILGVEQGGVLFTSFV